MNDNNNIIPILTYNNMDVNKSSIILDNKRKCGVYRITNLTNSKFYIGSSNNLSTRFRVYFNVNQLIRSNMYIYKAILKYGYSKFSLDIIEYCEPNLLISREQYYLDLLKPEYNILKNAHSFLGFKHSDETRIIMSIKKRGINHNLYGKTPTYDTRIKIGKALRSNTAIDIRPNLAIKKANLNTVGLKSTIRINIQVFDQTNNIVNEFPTMKSAALYYNVSTSTIRKILKNEIIHVGFTYNFEAMNNRV
jgi:group I intron endonuclease